MEDRKYCFVCGEPLDGRFCANCGFDTEKEGREIRAELTSDADRPAKSAETARPTAKNNPVGDADRAVFEAAPEPETENAAQIARDAKSEDEIRSFEDAKAFVGVAKEYIETAKEFVLTVRRNFETAERGKAAAPVGGAQKQAPNAIRFANASRVFGAVFAVLGFLLMFAPAGVGYGARFESVYLALAYEPLYSVVVFLLFSYSLLLAFTVFAKDKNYVFNSVFATVGHAFTLAAGIWLIVEMKRTYFVPSATAYCLPCFAALGLALSVSLFICALKENKLKTINAKTARVSVRKKLGFHAVAALLVAALGAAVLCGVTFTDRFRAGKADDVKIDYNRAQVKEILGEPLAGTPFNAEVYEYYSDDYADLTRQIASMEKCGLKGSAAALKEERDRLTYRYIRVSFGAYGIVREVLYDARKCDKTSSVYQKKWTENERGRIEISPSSIDSPYLTLTVYANIYYKDGSFKTTSLPAEATAAIDTSLPGKQILAWSDEWGSYTAAIEVEKR